MGRVLEDMHALRGDWVMSVNLNVRVPEWLDKICASPVIVYRRLKYGYSYRRIYLGENEYTIVEPADYYKFSKYKWILSGNGHNLYAVREVKIGPRNTKKSYLHREIIKPRKGKLVDHRNNDSLDNRRSNLRQATHSQNAINRPKTNAKTSSKYRGVYRDKRRRRWRAAIRWEHKGLHVKKTLGWFKNEIDAAKAYDKAAKKYHKDFARLNFP